MKLTFTPRQRKWIKRLVILFVIRLVLGAILYFVVVYRFKDIVQIMVKRQSKGLYAFDASNVEFSLWKKNIVVRDGVLHCTDTLRRPTHYDLKVPRIYLSIESWTALILHRKMLVDSLNIDSPDLVAHAHSLQLEKAGGVSFHASQVFDVLKRVVVHLQVRAFTLENGLFRYSNTRTGIPFVCDQINLSIRNFSPKDIRAEKEGEAEKGRQPDHLFSSDDVDLSLGPQHWMMPDGNHDLRFTRLHFSGRNEVFELDSCTFHSAAVGNNGDLSVSADKLFFNSRNLSAMYEREELLIDTLICIRPVLNLQIIDKKTQEDSTVVINKSIRHLFTDFSFRYIDIRDGQLRLGHTAKNQETYTQKTNLKIYNLRISPDSLHRVRTDSIAMNLRGIRFIAPDTLTQLSIGELTLDNQDLVLRTTVYGPAPRNRTDTTLTLASPLIRLQNYSLQDLLKRKLKAEGAVLYDPLITMVSKNKSTSSGLREDKDGKQTWGPDEKMDKWRRDQFNRALHGLRKLIDVGEFHIQSEPKKKANTRSIVAGPDTPRLIGRQFSFTEGASVDRKGNVYFTDQPNNRIWEYDVDGKLSVFLDSAGRSNGMYFDHKGRLVSCADEHDQLWAIGMNKKITVLLDNYQGHRLNGPNDLWIDGAGGIYFTDPYYQRPYWTRTRPDIEKENVYYLPKGARQPVIVDSAMVKPNGIVGTPDGKFLYVSDIGSGKTYKYRIAFAGHITNKKLYVSQGSDGMTLDDQGNLYLTGDGVTVYDPSGQKIAHIPVPEKWTANLCFGGRDKHSLFITASQGIYILRMRVRGVE
jgi:gluconolactonase